MTLEVWRKMNEVGRTVRKPCQYSSEAWGTKLTVKRIEKGDSRKFQMQRWLGFKSGAMGKRRSWGNLNGDGVRSLAIGVIEEWSGSGTSLVLCNMSWVCDSHDAPGVQHRGLLKRQYEEKEESCRSPSFHQYLKSCAWAESSCECWVTSPRYIQCSECWHQRIPDDYLADNPLLKDPGIPTWDPNSYLLGSQIAQNPHPPHTLA